tara:strand:- start:26 stop:829 length:804 start_codon:yes stop_codon:yes gene_type:complete
LSTEIHKGITIKSENEIGQMSQAGKIVAMTQVVLANALRIGISTLELDKIAEKEIRNHGAIPSFKGYMGFPSSICTSINNEIVHGIPSKRKIQNGDVLSIDVGAIYNGYHSDSAFTIGIGDITDKTKKLISDTKNALKIGINAAKNSARVGDIGSSIQKYGDKLNYGIVKQYVGHGIGRNLHEEPQVPNYGSEGKGVELKSGMAIAIEPMFNLGSWETKVLDDEWTVVTSDGSISAHFEDTIIITNDGSRVLSEIPEKKNIPIQKIN